MSNFKKFFIRAGSRSDLGRFVLIVMLSFHSLLYAQESTPDGESLNQDVDAEEYRLTLGPPFFSIFGGIFTPLDEPKFVNLRNTYVIGFGASGNFISHPGWAFDVEFFHVNRNFDTPISGPAWGQINDRTSVDTEALMLGGRYFHPVKSAMKLYLSMGFGFFQTEMRVSGSTFGMPGTFEKISRRFSGYVGAGMGYKIRDIFLSIDYRHISLGGSFSDFNISQAQLGGDMMLFGLTRSY